MKWLFISIVFLSSCKKEYTCVCNVTGNYKVVNDSQAIEPITITTTLGKVSKKEANKLCRDKTEVTDYSNFSTEYNYNCELK